MNLYSSCLIYSKGRLRKAMKKIPNAIGIIVMQPSFGINREKKDG
jgi:hypothetical protein